jgi:hypothetical protein
MSDYQDPHDPIYGYEPANSARYLGLVAGQTFEQRAACVPTSAATDACDLISCWTLSKVSRSTTAATA